MLLAYRPRPAGQAATPTPSIDSTGRIVGVDGMLDQIAVALAKPIQSDKALQREIGYGAGSALRGPAWLAAGALAVIAIAVVAKVTQR